MKTALFNKVSKKIIGVMLEENMYKNFKSALGEKYEGSELEDDNCFTIDTLEYYFDVTAKVVKESGEEIGTTFGYEEQRISFEAEIEYELTDLYYFVEQNGRDKIKMTGLLTDMQLKKLNESLN